MNKSYDKEYRESRSGVCERCKNEYYSEKNNRLLKAPALSNIIKDYPIDVCRKCLTDEEKYEYAASDLCKILRPLNATEKVKILKQCMNDHKEKQVSNESRR